MKRLITLFLCFFLLNSNNSFGQKGHLEFNKDGEFKIVQFTDLHIQDEVSDIIFETVKEIVDTEKPDLVVLTGDIIFQPSPDSLLQKLASIFADRKIHWTAVFGNHDDEFGTSRSCLSKKYSALPYNLNSTTSGIKGETNYVLSIAGKKSLHEALLYFFDSNTYNTLKKSVNSKYGWMENSQINWYRNVSASYTKGNNGVPVPALSFFHIPLPEYETLWEKDSVFCIGTKHENVCCPSVNSGMYVSMLECGDIMGTFVGHDHVNDYIGNLNGIALAYGRFTGSKNIYGFLKSGARVIILKEGKREFDTWIREKGGNLLYKCQYPKSFAQEKQKLQN
jgi:Predicted phosphohydrolases